MKVICFNFNTHCDVTRFKGLEFGAFVCDVSAFCYTGDRLPP